MLNLIRLLGNANQDHQEILQGLRLERLTVQIVGQNVEQPELLSVVGSNVKCSNHFGNWFQFLKKFTHILTVWSGSSTPGYSSKTYLHTETCMQIFIAFVSIELKCP